MQTIIDLKSVSFQHKNSSSLTLENINLTVKTGECLVIQGPSGSGKTSLCRLLNGLIPQAIEGELSGKILVTGKNVSQFRVQTMAKSIGMVMQDPESQIVGRTVYEDIAFGLRNFLTPKEEINKRVPEVLHQVGLTGFEHRKSDELSGGEKQRLAIAGILVTHPDILVLDEPVSELDPTGRESIYRLLRELQQETNLTLIIIERLIEDIINQIDRIILLNRGKMIWDGPPSELGDSIPPTPPKSSPVLSPKNRQQLFEIKKLFFNYPLKKPVLNHIDLDVFSNDYLAIVGHNGAGKTSLIKHLIGLLKPKSNQIYFKGKDITTLKMNQLVQAVGMVFQNPDHQLFESTVEKELSFGLINRKLKHEDIKIHVQKALSDAGLTSVKDLHPYSLPKGSRQLIAIASVMILKPEVLIIDEPTTGLDQEGVNLVMTLLDKLHQKGTTIILISHDIALVQQYAQRIIVMEKGTIIADSPTNEYFDTSRNLPNRSPC